MIIRELSLVYGQDMNLVRSCYKTYFDETTTDWWKYRLYVISVWMQTKKKKYSGKPPNSYCAEEEKVSFVSPSVEWEGNQPTRHRKQTNKGNILSVKAEKKYLSSHRSPSAEWEGNKSSKPNKPNKPVNSKEVRISRWRKVSLFSLSAAGVRRQPKKKTEKY